jgi:5-methylcytosine-specific restriction endonuclease McrA
VKKHVKIYLKALGYSGAEYMPCEVCQAPAVDVHHIKARGMGGSKSKDTLENLMGLCRACHTEYGDKTKHRHMLVEKHKQFLDVNTG